MREIELKSVVSDERTCEERLVRAGARREFAGRLEDRRFDTVERSLASRDLVLRLRVKRDSSGVRATLDWKGPTSYESGFKHRDETSVTVSDAVATCHILEQLGLVVSREIDREVRVYATDGATVRFERFPRMDTLVEVEGEPAAIERAIVTLGLPRDGFVPDRLDAFVVRFEARTGRRAALSEREARGEYLYFIDNA